jgi:hypothetical protein
MYRSSTQRFLLELENLRLLKIPGSLGRPSIGSSALITSAKGPSRSFGMLETLHACVECQGRWFRKARNDMIVDTVLRCGKAVRPPTKREVTVFPCASRDVHRASIFSHQQTRDFLSKF